jgi:hypothetical protein
MMLMSSRWSFSEWQIEGISLKVMKQDQSILFTYGYRILLTALLLCLCPLRSSYHFVEWHIDSLCAALFIFGLLLLGLALWSALVWRWSNHASVSYTKMTVVLLRVSLNMGATFPSLMFWYRSALTRLMIHEMPAWELWLVSFALAWMTAPIVVLWLLPVGARIGGLLSSRD